MDDHILQSFLKDSAKRLHALASVSDVLSIMAQRGDPASAYLCSFEGIEHLVRNARGVVHKSSEPILVEVKFPPDYLKSVDTARLGLKVAGIMNGGFFHPNVRPPAFCLGDLQPGTPADELLRLVYEVLSYQNVTPDERNAFNPEACRYVRDHDEVIKGLRIAPLRRRNLNVKTTVEVLEAGNRK